MEIGFISIREVYSFIIGFYAFPFLCVPAYWFGRFLGFLCRKAYHAVVAHFEKENKQ